MTIIGRVQGVGLRPAIVRVAAALGLAGEVSNTGEGVDLILEGPRAAIDAFCPALFAQLPLEACIQDIRSESAQSAHRRGFQIRLASTAASIQTEVPRDLNVCGLCLAELADSSDRRHEYPFLSCTDCGPRFSIIQTLPFERAATTMHGFELCPACRAEYANPVDRRFHSQTMACPQCGPACWFAGRDNAISARGSAAIAAAVTALLAGAILALKGLGGYQLLVDATNAEAVRRLRQRKLRPRKPLAVMTASLTAAESLAHLDDVARASLSSRTGPIVVVPAKSGAVAAEVHPGLDCIGLMLPTTPLHWLLARRCPPLIATSGNREGEPLAWDERDAGQRLASIGECFLHHNRPIQRAIDDSVVRIIAARPVTIRAARGLAPLSLALSGSDVSLLGVLAVGGQQKSAVALHNGSQAILGPHLGDLDELNTRGRFSSHVQDLCRLYQSQPQYVVHDAHPDYFTTRWAAQSGAKTIAVQHHHAHIVASMIESNWLDREVLGVAWDGTGYGPDGTVWGGEFLQATATSFHRVARLRPFPLYGGEAAVREPWRATLAVLCDALGPATAVECMRERGFDQRQLTRLLEAAGQLGFSPLTSSAGRLFDAVAVWLLPFEVDGGYASAPEGHWACLLEAASWRKDLRPEENALPSEYRMPLGRETPNELDWRPLISALVGDFRRGASPACLAARFHTALADGIVEVALRYRGLPVVLGGGVFQNRQLTEAIARRVAAHELPLGLPGVIPPGDGGLAAGQLAIGLARLASAKSQLSSLPS